ncbi:hypothetical protein J2Z66_004755 [Paenibacillus eucommiae]|uniref:Uncharacterized protein n=1 Tax=Paenibacillus eucommiae TaxID=1355755 RepID=A0ABS4IZX4_9BACL|nr:hypothetical protein [Paenibacillus eucommiae]
MRTLPLFHPQPFPLQQQSAEHATFKRTASKVYLWIGGDFLADQDAGTEERPRHRLQPSGPTTLTMIFIVKIPYIRPLRPFVFI